jgi:hypothetical protein
VKRGSYELTDGWDLADVLPSILLHHSIQAQAAPALHVENNAINQYLPPIPNLSFTKFLDFNGIVSRKFAMLLLVPLES